MKNNQSPFKIGFLLTYQSYFNIFSFFYIDFIAKGLSKCSLE